MKYLMKLILIPIIRRCEHPYEKIKIDDELSFRFVPSGHLLKGCQLELYITVKNVTKKILYTLNKSLYTPGRIMTIN